MTKDDLVTILLVEDNKIDRISIERAFQRKGITNPVVHAGDGLEALEVLRGQNGDPPLEQPYVILLDLNMPRMSGLEFLEELRGDEKLRKSIVFVLTTSEDDRDKAASYDKNVAGYLSKNDAGGDFMNVIQLLDQFQISIHFPPQE